ncbi:MAG: hypothetical protein JXR40_08255 [Pontiellaceae bacterium]|nr:hypothetical protein [Pontiellaceae bacterium]
MTSRKSIFYLAALSFAVFLFLTGCSSIPGRRPADPHVITHHTWWNHYQRGRLFLQENNYTAARRDFEIALGRHPGARYPYAQERWKARTYGLHTIEGYFPHRELGICLFYLNRPTEALTLLESSMNMEPSARAKFYMNRIREEMATAAAPAPQIQLEQIPERTSNRTLILRGTASGTNEVMRLIINGEPEFIELADHRISFQKELQLKEGPNPIEILAEDISGKQTLTNLVLTADWTPPQIHLNRTNNELCITCTDNLALGTLQLNTQSVPTEGTEFSMTRAIASNQPLLMTVTDLAGNRATWSLSERELTHLQQNSAPAPPILHLDHAGQTVVQFSPEYVLDICAEDDTALESVEFNTEPVLTRASPLFRSLLRIPLVAGTNQLSIAVEDSDGNRTEETIGVVYRQPEYLDRIYRLAALLSPLAGEVQDHDQIQRVSALISENLTADPVRFYLLASEDDTARLQNEYNLSCSKLSDPRALLRQGKNLDADLLFIPRILSDAPGHTIYTQVLDAHSGAELFIEDVYVEEPEQLPTQLSGLVMKLEQRFPVIQGTVLSDEKRLWIDAGETAGVQEGMRLLVIRSPSSFENGQLVVDQNRPVELVISEVESTSAIVIMAKGFSGNTAHPGDYVYSR